MKFSILLIAFFSFSAQAHFKLGTYKGFTTDGVDCTIIFERVSFTTVFKHPLSERVTVVAQGKTFTLQHPSQIDETSVLYNDMSLETVIPFQSGAEFFKVAMIHSDTKEGPDSYAHMVHDWKKNQVTKLTCENLFFLAE